MKRGNWIKTTLARVVGLCIGQTGPCGNSGLLNTITTTGNPVVDQDLTTEVSLPSRGDDIFAAKVMAHEGGVSGSLNRVIGEPDERYVKFEKPTFGSAYLVVAFEKPFSEVHAFVRVNGPVRITGYSGEIVHSAKVMENKSNEEPNSLYKLVAGTFLTDRNRSESGIADIPHPDFAPDCAVNMQFDVGHTPERIFILEMAGDVEVDGFALPPGWAPTTFYDCNRSSSGGSSGEDNTGDSSRGDPYVDDVSYVNASLVTGPPDGVHAYIGFGDLVEARFTDNVPRNGFGNDIRIYTQGVNENIEYAVIVSTSSDIKDISGKLLAGSRDIEVDIGDLAGDFSNLTVGVINAGPYGSEIGIDAIEALYNE